MILIYPERLLLSYLDNNKNFPQEVLKNLSSLPQELIISEACSEKITIYIKEQLIKALTEVFEFRTLYFNQNDLTIQATITSPIFWENINFTFTDHFIEAIWEEILKGDKKLKYKKVNPWEALLLEKILRNISYSFEWLYQHKATWLVSAYYIIQFNKRKSSSISDELPFLSYFENYQEVPFSLRFILVEEVSTYFKSLIKELTSLIETLSVEGLTYDLYETSIKLITDNPFSNLKTDKVIEAFNYWCEEGSLNFDDFQYLKRVESNNELKATINELKNLYKTLETIRRELKV